MSTSSTCSTCSTSSTSFFFFSSSFFFFCCCCLSAAGAELAAPQNVSWAALNDNYTLVWDWDSSVAPDQDVTFTTDYIDKFKLKDKNAMFDWTTVCGNSSRKSCCLTEYLEYLAGYVVRVRASVNRRHSNWTEIPFWPDRDANLGPPSSVVLSPAGSSIDVNILDPLTTTNHSMKEKLPHLEYYIVYWKGPGGPQAAGVHNLSAKINLVTLPDLKAQTVYCVMVQCRNKDPLKRSDFTQPLCLQTEGTMVWWGILLCFLISLVICFFVVLFLIFGFSKTYYSIKDKLFPSSQLPKHFQEYLSDSPGSDLPRLLIPESESKLLCDKVTICPQVPSAPPAGLEQDSSGWHSRQISGGSDGSGGSGGSGRSDESGDSSDSGIHSGGVHNSTGSFCSEQVTMRDMALESKSAVVDEGIMDMCM